MSSTGRTEAMVVTAWVMTVSTIQLFVAVVLAASLIADLGLTRWQIGVLGAVNTGVGAAVAPALGRLADRLGARRAMVGIVVVSALGLALTAIAVDYWLLVVASAVAGIPQGSGNSVTNKVIVEEVPPAEQGAVTGVKQSGVQLAVFISGATLPTAAASVGWRAAVGVFAAVTLASVVLIRWRFPDRPRPSAATAGTEEEPAAGSSMPTDPFVVRVAVYAFLLGAVAGGITRFYPLFAQEVLDFSEPTAGLAVSITGATAIVARLVWAWIADRVLSSRVSLGVLGLGAAVAAGLLIAAETVDARILWPAVVLAAFTVVAWNVVAMLAVIRTAPAAGSGRATGLVLMGFLGGLTVSAPTVGLAVDRFGSYRPVWAALAVFALVGAAVISAGGSSAVVADDRSDA